MSQKAARAVLALLVMAGFCALAFWNPDVLIAIAAVTGGLLVFGMLVYLLERAFPSDRGGGW